MLMDHEEERRQDVGEWRMFQRSVVDVIKQNTDVKDDDLLHHLIGILSINCVGINIRADRVYGRALYPTLSLISHSCVANTRYTGSDENNHTKNLITLLQ